MSTRATILWTCDRCQATTTTEMFFDNGWQDDAMAPEGWSFLAMKTACPKCTDAFRKWWARRT